MSPHRLLTIVAVSILLAGCSGDRKAAPVPPPAGVGDGPAGAAQPKPGPAAGGEAAFRIEPAEAYRGTKLRLFSASVLPAGATVEWIVNGKVVQSGGLALDGTKFRKGDAVQARLAGGAPSAVSRTVAVRNSPPEIRGIRFVLGDAKPGILIGVETETFDADGDAVRVDIAWRKNGVPAGAGSRLAVPVKRGDKVDVTIAVHDGEVPGKSATLSREIRNTPPVIEGQEQFQVDGNVVTFHVRASDPDGDPLAYAVKDAPAGMKIDRSTGWVRWETAPGTIGKIPFTVAVSDGAGGESTARFTVTIAEPPASGAR